LLHPLDGLTLAMKELPGAVLTYIGRGAKLGSTREAARGLPNVRFFDYQAFDQLADSLAACDLAVVAIEPGADRLAMPSKLQGILASGRPVLVLAPIDSELAQIVERHDCGWVVADYNNAQAVARTIKEIIRNDEERRKRGALARRVAETTYSVQSAADAYLRAIEA
jgi:colanic acid biosynthesis glycosyl transferase WcaI